MSSNPKSFSSRWIPQTLAFVVLGAAMGYLLLGGSWGTAENSLLLVAAGFAWAALALQIGNLAGQAADLLAHPTSGLDPADPVSVKAKLSLLSGRGELNGRVKRALEAWSQGWSPREVIGLAAFQSAAARKPVYAGAAFAIVVFVLAIQQGHDSILISGGIALASLVMLARLSLLSRADHYVEQEILCRLPGNLPNTAITASQLGDAVGSAIEKAFSQHVPQPEKTAAAIGSAVEGAGKAIAAEADKIQKALAQVQSALGESLPAAGKAAADELAKAQNQLGASIAESGKKFAEQVAGVQGALVNGLTESGMKTSEALRSSQEALSTGLASAVKQVADVLGGVQKSLEGSLSGAGREAAQQLSESLNTYAAQLGSATKALSGEIEQLGIAQQSIEKLLHVEEAVDGTLKSIAAMDEFKETLHSLRVHIEESDKLIKEASKPRTITLIEEDGEVRAV